MHRSFGRAISARPIATICCSPPDSVPASCLQPLLDAREEREDALQICLEFGRVVAGEGAHLEVLEHRHAREEAPRLRAPGAMPRLTRSAVATSLMRCAVDR